jgi:restriction system protein
MMRSLMFWEYLSVSYNKLNMARRKQRESDAERLFEAVAEASSLVPWWITIPIAALLFYFVPDVYVEPNFSDPSSMGSALVVMFLKALLKYALPMALIAGAILSIFNSFKSGSIFNSINKEGVRKTLQSLSWQDFEFLLSEWFKKEGYSTELTGGGGADGGVDIKLYKEGELYLVQCKHYKVGKVNVQTVRELFGVMASQGAAGGYVITSGNFTNDAVAFAKGTSITLIDGEKLEEILHVNETTIKEKSVITAKSCPKCGSSLVERNGRRGKFIGCSNYPQCRHTENIN